MTKGNKNARLQRKTGALLVQGVGERIPTRVSWQEFKEKFQDPDILSQEDIRFIADLLLWGEIVLFKASLKENASDRWFRVRLYALS